MKECIKTAFILVPQIDFYLMGWIRPLLKVMVVQSKSMKMRRQKPSFYIFTKAGVLLIPTLHNHNMRRMGI